MVSRRAREDDGTSPRKMKMISSFHTSGLSQSAARSKAVYPPEVRASRTAPLLRSMVTIFTPPPVSSPVQRVPATHQGVLVCPLPKQLLGSSQVVVTAARIVKCLVQLLLRHSLLPLARHLPPPPALGLAPGFRRVERCSPRPGPSLLLLVSPPASCCSSDYPDDQPSPQHLCSSYSIVEYHPAIPPNPFFDYFQNPGSLQQPGKQNL